MFRSSWNWPENPGRHRTEHRLLHPARTDRAGPGGRRQHPDLARAHRVCRRVRAGDFQFVALGPVRGRVRRGRRSPPPHRRCHATQASTRDGDVLRHHCWSFWRLSPLLLFLKPARGRNRDLLRADSGKAAGSSATPRHAPCWSKASSAYSEQVGWNRQCPPGTASRSLGTPTRQA